MGLVHIIVKTGHVWMLFERLWLPLPFGMWKCKNDVLLLRALQKYM